MKLVIDTNLVFSALLNTSSKIGDLLMNSDGLLTFYSTETLSTEIETHKKKLLGISKMSESEFSISKEKIFSKINWTKEVDIPFPVWNEAAQLVREVDMDDVAFVALSKYLDAKLWTGDKTLIKGLISKGFSNVIMTDEVYQIRELLK